MSEPTSEPTPLEALRRVLESRPLVRDDPDVLRNVLLDLCPVRRAEVNWLVNAAHERVPARIADAGDDMPRGVLVGAIKMRLMRDLGMTSEAAAWTSSTWYDALRGSASSAPSVEPEPVAAIEPHEAEAPTITLDQIGMLREQEANRARLSLFLVVVMAVPAAWLLVHLPFFGDDFASRVDSLRTRDVRGLILGNGGPAALALYGLAIAGFVAAVRNRLDNLRVAERRRALWTRI